MKKELRDAMLMKRLAMSSDDIHQASLSLLSKVKQHPAFLQATHIGLFHPIKNEPDLTDLLQIPNKHFYLPKVVEMSLIYAPFTKDTSLETSTLNIKEPIGLQDYSHRLDLVIIPALAVDAKGNRLGFGKGYFDRFLERHPHLKVLAVVYPFQVVDLLPVEQHDKQVTDILVSD
jgi:5-formyltetrahydrofolate cyclo-ligase